MKRNEVLMSFVCERISWMGCIRRCKQDHVDERIRGRDERARARWPQKLDTRITSLRRCFGERQRITLLAKVLGMQILFGVDWAGSSIRLFFF